MDARHGKAGALRKIAHERDEFRRGTLVDFPRAVQREHELVGVPVAHEVHHRGDQQGHHRAARPADEETDGHEQGREPCQQHGGSHIIHDVNPTHSAR